mgnify:CR=1 FL=1
MTAVLKHELRLYFHSLTAYVFGAFLLAFVGIGAVLYNIQAAVSNFEFVLNFSSLIFVVIVPILTMRVIAEEKKQKTDQLLYSLPISTTQVILGKYAALLILYLIPLAIISLYPLIFSQFGDVYLLTSYGSILAFFILGAALIAVGMFISSLTDNQGMAAGIGIAVILLNYYSVSLPEYVSATAAGSAVALVVLFLAMGAVIRYVTKNGTLAYTILLGGYSTMDSQRYVSIGDGNVYLVADDPLDNYDVGLRDLLDPDDIPDFDQVSKITFTGSENYEIFYEAYEEGSTRTYCADDVYFAQQEDGTLPLDTDKVTSYLQTIRYLDLSDYVTYNVTDEELAQYGLDDPQLTIQVDYTEENEDGDEVSDTFTLHISRDPEELAKAEESESENEDDTEEEITAYMRVGDSPIVYRLYSESYSSLMRASCDDLRHAELLTAAFADITQIDISLEDADYTITTDGSGDDRTYAYLETEVEIDDFRDALESLQADSFTDEAPAQKEEIRLTLHLDNAAFPTVEISLYRYDGSSCLAVVDGVPTALVERSQVVDLIEAVNAIVLN